MKEKRLLMEKETFSLHNDIILNKILLHPRYQSSKMVGIYVSLPDEVSTHDLIKHTLKYKRVCVPKIENKTMNFYEISSFKELKEGHFHVLEPINKNLISYQDIDLMITPLLAFDENLYRVGYGKGYYDKYFSKGFHGYKLGIAFSCQKVDKIKIDQYDYQLDEIITEF